MPPYLRAFAIGVAAGLRALTPLAVVSFAAHDGRLRVGKTPLAFLTHPATRYVAAALAAAELINDKLPGTPSRKAPPAFAARVALGALCGAALTERGDSMVAGALAGAGGALVGTLGGYELRAGLVRATGGTDLPIALLEDCIAIGSASGITAQAA
jgi:uncharacterized membrane protein